VVVGVAVQFIGTQHRPCISCEHRRTIANAKELNCLLCENLLDATV